MTDAPDPFLTELRMIVGASFVLTDAQETAPYITEYRGRFIGTTRAVVLPADTGEVSAVVALCARYKIAITPQGGNTGLVGGSIAYDPDTITLNLSRMNAIRHIDPENFSITAEAGCVLQTVQHHAIAHDRFFPLSLASEGSCRMGGVIASNAGGILTMRYGNTRDLVLGLEVVLPDGSIWNGLRSLRKDNTGYDLKQLFIGSEGTLGIITAATLKIFADPGPRDTFFAATCDVRHAVTLLSQLRAQFGDALMAFELIARRGVEFACMYNPQCTDPLTTKAPWYILGEVAGFSDGRRTDIENALAAAMESGLIGDATLAQNEQQRSMFWTLRESISDAQRYVGGSIKHDISVPITAIADFIDEACTCVMGMISDARPVVFGHLGDGNLHFNISQPEDMQRDAFMAQWDNMTHAMHDIVMRYNGSFSAEHGIGTFKAGELQARRDLIEIRMMRAIKSAIDPDNRMNPGKILLPWTALSPKP